MSGTFLVTDTGNNQVAGSLTFAAGGALAIFTPTAPLLNSSAYTVKATTGCKDLAGTPMADDFILTFTTKAADSPPVVTTSIPSDGSIDVDPTQPIQVQWDKPMDITTITTS